MMVIFVFFFFSSRRRHTRWTGDWSSDVCSSDLALERARAAQKERWGGRRQERDCFQQEVPALLGRERTNTDEERPSRQMVLLAEGTPRRFVRSEKAAVDPVVDHPLLGASQE